MEIYQGSIINEGAISGPHFAKVTNRMSQVQNSAAASFIYQVTYASLGFKSNIFPYCSFPGHPLSNESRITQSGPQLVTKAKNNFDGQNYQFIPVCTRFYTFDFLGL